jgi:hypothetical protein
VAKKLDFGTGELEVLQRVVDEAIETEQAFQAHEEADGVCLGAPLFEVEGMPVMTEMKADSISYEENLKRVKAKLEEVK